MITPCPSSPGSYKPGKYNISVTLQIVACHISVDISTAPGISSIDVILITYGVLLQPVPVAPIPSKNSEEETTTSGVPPITISYISKHC